MIFIIIRGLPGSGKSTYIKNFIKNLAIEKSCIISADDYFKCGDYYLWNKENLYAAHLRCYNLFEKALKEKIPYIFLDNTNINNQAYKKYVDLLIKEYPEYGLLVVSLYDSDLSDEELVERNTHGVDLETMKSMRARYNKEDYYGLEVPK